MELTSASIAIPERLDLASVTGCRAAFQTAQNSDAAVITITGANRDVFCLGLELDTEHSDPDSIAIFADFLNDLHESPKPLLGIVDGAAIGGGMGVACSCDMVLATPHASFALPELLWGLIPAVIWPVIAQRMSPQEMRRWTVSAHSRTASEAMAAGILDRMVEPENLEQAAQRAVKQLGRLEPGALRQLRSWMRQAQADDMQTALAAGAALTGAMLKRPERGARWAQFSAGGAPWSA